MKSRPFWLLALCGAAVVSLRGQAALSPEHKDWLETVRPIITEAERALFLKLGTPADREKFIRFFWKNRDPVPDTPENEFQKEYDDRVRFADLNFRSGTGRRGSRTERGYYYLLLGKPLERHLFTTESQMWPLELWFYQGDERFGLPPYFYLIFYQAQGLGDYRLYHPAVEGPEKLVVPLLFGQTLNRANAYRFLRNISAELAAATISYIPGEGSDRTLDLASLGSETVINAARGLAEKKFDDAYARTFAHYKDYVETDYADRYVGSSAVIKVFSHAGQPFIHWSVEPDRISFAEYQGTFYATYEIVLKLEAKDGTPLLERTEEVPIRLTAEQYKAHERQRLAFQDVLPVVPGDLRLFVLLKNKTGKDFTSFNAAVTVGSGAKGLQTSSLLLFHGRVAPSSSGAAPRLRAFTFEGVEYVFNARNEFLPQESLSAFVQVLPGEGRIPESSVFRLDIFSANSTAPAASQSATWKPSGEPSGSGLEVGPIPLSGLGPGYYRAELSFVGAENPPLLIQKENFIILGVASPVLPWVFSRQHPPYPNAEHLVSLGSQYFMLRDYDRARECGRKALGIKDEPAARLLLGKALYALKEYKASIQAIGLIHETDKNREAAKILALDYAGEEDWPNALTILEALMKDSTEVAVLNLAAEGYVKTGQPDKAVPLLEKSLSLVPGQPTIKEMLDRLRK
jgi:GWxTD domain-containing protein